MSHIILTLSLKDEDEASVNWESMGLPIPAGDKVNRKVCMRVEDIRRIETTSDKKIQKIVYFDEDYSCDYAVGSFNKISQLFIAADTPAEVEEEVEEEPETKKE